MRKLLGGRAVISGIAAVIAGLILAEVANRHRGGPTFTGGARVVLRNAPGWSDTLYDTSVVLAWSLILVGLVIVIAGLIRYAAKQRAAT
ncbi:MAG TPA: hypothetical protein VH061_05190 [Solirubrobacteraceae bacterium]|nr:hypothetical protein [Solirubrobacteraceae bacterium]